MKEKKRKLDLYNLVDMLKEVDLEKNDTETIKEVLNFVAEKLKDYIEEE